MHLLPKLNKIQKYRVITIGGMLEKIRTLGTEITINALGTLSKPDARV